jgi:hypothetical protein
MKKVKFIDIYMVVQMQEITKWEKSMNIERNKVNKERNN